MATVRKKVTAGYHSCTGPEQCLSCGLVGLRCALGEIQDKRKHQGRTMVFTLFTKDAFPSAAGRMHTESPSAASASYHTSRPQSPFSSKASVTAALQEDRSGFWPSTSNPCLLHFPKAFVRYIISSDSCHVIREGNIMPPFFSCQYCWGGKKPTLEDSFQPSNVFGHICWSLS